MGPYRFIPLDGRFHIQDQTGWTLCVVDKHDLAIFVEAAANDAHNRAYAAGLEAAQGAQGYNPDNIIVGPCGDDSYGQPAAPEVAWVRIDRNDLAWIKAVLETHIETETANGRNGFANITRSVLAALKEA